MGSVDKIAITMPRAPLVLIPGEHSLAYRCGFQVPWGHLSTMAMEMEQEAASGAFRLPMQATPVDFMGNQWEAAAEEPFNPLNGQ